MFVSKYWSQISAILKPDFLVVKNLTKKKKGGVAASRLYKKDSQYKLAKAIFVDSINIIIEKVSDGHLVELADDIYFQVDYKEMIPKFGNPYKTIERARAADGKIPYIFFYFKGNKIKVIPSKSITQKMLDRMGNGYRFTRRLN